jgi:hypothetical protein
MYTVAVVRDPAVAYDADYLRISGFRLIRRLFSAPGPCWVPTACTASDNGHQLLSVPAHVLAPRIPQ